MHTHTHTHEKLERESEAVANVERPMPNGHPLVAAIYLLVLLVAWPPPPVFSLSSWGYDCRFLFVVVVLRALTPILFCMHTRRPFQHK